MKTTTTLSEIAHSLRLVREANRGPQVIPFKNLERGAAVFLALFRAFRLRVGVEVRDRVKAWVGSRPRNRPPARGASPHHEPKARRGPPQGPQEGSRRATGGSFCFLTYTVPGMGQYARTVGPTRSFYPLVGVGPAGLECFAFLQRSKGENYIRCTSTRSQVTARQMTTCSLAMYIDIIPGEVCSRRGCVEQHDKAGLEKYRYMSKSLDASKNFVVFFVSNAAKGEKDLERPEKKRQMTTKNAHQRTSFFFRR